MKFYTLGENGDLTKRKEVEEINKYVAKGDQLFLFVFMDGCGPCNHTKPSWDGMKMQLENKYRDNGSIIVARVNNKLFDDLKGVGTEPMGYPSLRQISRGKVSEYEDDDRVREKDRSTKSFVEWVNVNVVPVNAHKMTRHHRKNISGGSNIYNSSVRRVKKNVTKRKYGGKWSLKYKRSINCKRPRGFSQRQHCKYGKK